MLTDSIIFEYGEVLCRDDGAKQLIWDMTHIFSVTPCRLDGAKQLFWDMTHIFSVTPCRIRQLMMTAYHSRA